MTYQAATLPITATPAKDLMNALGAQFLAGGLSLVESYAPPATTLWSAVVYGGGQFVAVANGYATAATSPDGITWTPRALPAVSTWAAVAYGGGTYVAISSGTSNLAATSPDGITWTLRYLPAVGDWRALAYGNGMFVALYNGGTQAATSPDGVTWTLRPSMNLPGAMASWSAVAYNGSLFVAVGTGTTTCATSPDGITWTARTLPLAANWQSVTYGSGLWVTINNGVAVATSPDGITWTQRTLPSSGNYTSVAYGNGVFLAVSSTSTNNIAVSSPDGITWTSRTLPNTSAWYGVAYGAGVFTLMTNSTFSLSSPDVVTYTLRTMTGNSSSAWSDVYKSPGASNQFGSDWYLILRRTGDFATPMYYQVAEQYNASTHRASNYGGLGSGAVVAPAPGTYANPGSPLSPESASASQAVLALTAGTAVPYWVSVNPNRVIVAVRTTAEQGFYAGLYDDLLPAGTTQFPLMAAKFPSTVTNVGAIGNGASPVNTGGFTREPLQTVAVNHNFEACIHNGYLGGAGSFYAYSNFTPMSSPTPMYGNPSSPSRVMVGSSRATAATADAVRGLLIGCVCSTVASVVGDTITAGGKTYVRFAGPNSSYGYFVDQAL